MVDVGLTSPQRTGPLISVIIPTFNRKNWLRAAIESVLAQDYQNVEIVVVDDGSSDGTQEILCDLIARADIKYIYQSNTGRPAAARNRGLRESTGSIVVFLDSDDLLLPGSVSRRLGVLAAFPQVGFVCTNWQCFSGSAEGPLKPSRIITSRFMERLPTELIDFRRDDVVVFQAPFVYELFNSDFVNTSTVMVRREVLDRVGTFDESFVIGEDYDLWLRVGLHTRMAFVESPLGLLRTHNGHLTGDEHLNFEQDALVALQFIKARSNLPSKWRKRFMRRLAQFYRTGGATFLRSADRRRAVRFFLMAWRCEPASMENVKWIFRCLVPSAATLPR